MSRDPLLDPRFGDVFAATASPVTRDERILYLAPAPVGPGWIGMRLDELSVSDPTEYIPLSERYVGWVAVEAAEIIVEMTCDHPAHRGRPATLNHANDIWRGCTYRRVA